AHGACPGQRRTLPDPPESQKAALIRPSCRVGRCCTEPVRARRSACRKQKRDHLKHWAGQSRNVNAGGWAAPAHFNGTPAQFRVNRRDRTVISLPASAPASLQSLGPTPATKRHATERK